MNSHPVPGELLGRPFTTRQAIQAGVTKAALSGPRYSRIHRGVYAVRGSELGLHERIHAARLALPTDAYVSHVTRVQQLGLDVGAQEPLHFTVARDLHVTPRGVFLHRTKVLPPVSNGGVSPAAAFIGAAATYILLDLIVIGDWLLHRRLMTIEEVALLAHRDHWRPGASQAVQVLPYLDGRAASPPESRSRTYVVFSGLPEPLVNVPVTDDPNSPIMDLYLPEWRFAIEYEGGHHFRDPAQIKRDTWRYAILRAEDVEYMQVYDEILAHPVTFVRLAHGLLVPRGYDGPPPDFGPRWQQLWRPLPAQQLRPQRAVD